MKNKGNLYILLTALLWSTSGVLIKFVTGSSIAINGARSLIAFLFFALYKKSFKMKVNGYILLASFCLMMTNILFVSAVKMTTAANAITLQYLAPIFVLIWSALYNKKLPSLLQVICVLMAFAGMVLFFYDGLKSGYLLGNAIAVCAGLCFSGVFFINSLPESSSEDSSMIAFLASFIVSIPFLNSIEFSNIPSTVALVFLGTFQVGLAYVLYGKGCKLTTPLNASLISLSEVVFNPLWVFIVFHETISTYAFIGATVIIISIILNTLFSKEV